MLRKQSVKGTVKTTSWRKFVDSNEFHQVDDLSSQGISLHWHVPHVITVFEKLFRIGSISFHRYDLYRKSQTGIFLDVREHNVDSLGCLIIIHLIDEHLKRNEFNSTSNKSMRHTNVNFVRNYTFDVKETIMANLNLHTLMFCEFCE